MKQVCRLKESKHENKLIIGGKKVDGSRKRVNYMRGQTANSWHYQPQLCAASYQTSLRLSSLTWYMTIMRSTQYDSYVG